MKQSLLNRFISLSRRLAEKPEWRMFYLQRFVLEYRSRQAIASALARRLPQESAVQKQPQRAAELAEQFLRTGVVVLPGLLAESEAASVRARLSEKTCHGDSVHKYYDLQDVLSTPGVVELINHPLIVSVAQHALGCKPTLSEVTAWWNFHHFDRGEGSEDHAFYVDRPLEYHRDIDDWMVVRVLVYLTDVSAEAGPHTYVPNSNRKNIPAFRGVNLAEAPFKSLYEDRLDILGPAGTVIIMNPYGLHRGVVPKSADRLMLGFSYSLHPTYLSPSDPVVDLDSTEFCDPYVNRLFVSFGRPA